MNLQIYDIVVIGAGSGGLTTAVGFAKIGKKVLLVEKEHMGGECTNSGCIPSKALLHYAKEYRRIVEVVGESPKSEAFRADAFAYVRKKINAVLAKETPKIFKKEGIDVVLGEAVFKTKCSIEVAGAVYGYKKRLSPRGLPLV